MQVRSCTHSEGSTNISSDSGNEGHQLLNVLDLYVNRALLVRNFVSQLKIEQDVKLLPPLSCRHSCRGNVFSVSGSCLMRTVHREPRYREWIIIQSLLLFWNRNHILPWHPHHTGMAGSPSDPQSPVAHAQLNSQTYHTALLL